MLFLKSVTFKYFTLKQVVRLVKRQDIQISLVTIDFDSKFKFKYQQDIALPFSDVLELFDVAQNMIIQIRLGSAAQNITNEETKEQKK